MTGRERALTMFRRQPVDRLPYFDLICNDAVIEHYAGEALTIESGRRVVMRALDNLVDATRPAILTPQEPETHVTPDGWVHQQQRWTGWTHPPAGFDVEDAVALLEDAIRQMDAWGDEDVQAVHAREDAYFALRDEFRNTYVTANYLMKTGITVYEGIGLDLFSYIQADQPELISRYLESHTCRSVRALESMRRLHEVEVVFSGEDIAAGDLLFSPAFLRREFLPRLERIIDVYHRHGVTFLFHSDGNQMEILDDLVAVGVDALNPLETKAGMELAAVRRRHPDLVLVGGIDCSAVLPFGTPDAVRKETEKCLREALPWYLPGSSSEVHNQVPLANVQAMVETIHNFRW